MASTTVLSTDLADHDNLVEEVVRDHGGDHCGTRAGSFDDPAAAVAAALALQLAMADRTDLGQVRPPPRIALHAGTVARADCLRDIGHGGQILLSDSTTELVGSRLPDQATLRSLGAHRLRDLGPVERVWQLCHPSLVQDFPPPRSLDTLPNNLPVRLTTFVGRGAELAELTETATGHGASRLVTLTGAGGSGKSALALHLAAETIDRHPDGTWWVELGALSDSAVVGDAVASAIGVRRERDRTVVETLADAFQDGDVLVVLDNCEHLLDAAAELASGLLRAAPNLRIVATSREPLGVAGEVAWRVPSLDEQAAVRLFVERAAEVRRGFAPDDAERAVIARICRRLDGLPLAIELAAARIRMMHSSRIAAGLDDRFRLLTGGARGSLPRQQTLEASVAWSYELLEEEERIVLRRLAGFAGGFTLDAAEAVCADGQHIDGYDVLDLLTRLIDKSLVQDDAAAETRYSLLETIRHYAGVRLIESGEADDVRSRHLANYLALAERAEPLVGEADGPAWLDRLDRDHDNFRVALEWADATGQHDALVRLATALAMFWELRGHQGVGSRWLSQALAHDGEPSAERARCLAAAAHMGIYGGDVASTIECAPEAIAIAQHLGDERTLARAGNTLSYLTAVNTPASALADLAGNIELARSNGDTWAVADGLKMSTVAWMVAGDYEHLQQAANELGTVARRLGNQFFLAWHHAALGYIALQRADLATARQEFETSIGHCAKVGDPATGWLATAWLATADALSGFDDRAEARYAEVIQRGGPTGGGMGRDAAIPDLARLQLGRGDAAAAERLVGAHVDEFLAEVPSFKAPFFAVLGALLAARGDEAGARAALDEAGSAARQIGNPMLTSLVDHELGCVERQQGATALAEDLHHRALAARYRNGLSLAVAESLEAIAGIAAAHESGAEAARIFAAADRLRTELGTPRRSDAQPGYEDDIAAARAQLGYEAFASAWAEGAALDADQAVAYVSRARGERRRPSSGWDSLTPTEIEVVRLAAEGLTNPEIGERLFIGRGTVKTHLSHVFTKLGVANRAELAAKASLRLVEPRSRNRAR